MNKKHLKILLTAAILILAVCLGLTLAMKLRQAPDTENPPAQESGTTQAQDTVTTPVQDLVQDATLQTDGEQDLLPLDTSDGLEETKPAETTGNQADPGTPPDAPTQPSGTTATEPSGESPTETPTEEPTEGTLPPNMLPIG